MAPVWDLPKSVVSSEAPRHFGNVCTLPATEKVDAGEPRVQLHAGGDIQPDIPARASRHGAGVQRRGEETGSCKCPSSRWTGR